jgi:hypothetical protein
MRAVTTENHAWAAGVIDGEGCITVKKNGPYYSMQVIVAQSGYEPSPMIEELTRLYGGNSRQAKPKNRTPVWHWQVVGANAEKVLKHVSPYLIQKRDQAEVALRFRTTLGAPGVRVPDAHKRNSELAYRELRELKNYMKVHAKWRIKDEQSCSGTGSCGVAASGGEEG